MSSEKHPSILHVHHGHTWQDWAAMATLFLLLGGYFVHLEGRISRVEQKVDDLITYVHNHNQEPR